jgi:hypothetical protein
VKKLFTDKRALIKAVLEMGLGQSGWEKLKI